MISKTTLTLLILTMLSLQLKAQTSTDSYFTSPLDPPLILKGTFGEIRPDHFHSGIDLSTGDDEDKNVYAVAEGYVSRVKVSVDGFGKALYITHPNGLVSVYAHLKRFGNDVQHDVEKAQYEQKSYEVELLPKAKEMKVKKGELIGLTGSTGDVAGPHLHFEMRNSATEEPVNPLFFGFKVEDTLPPVVSLIRIFPLRGEGILNTTDTAATYFVKKNNSTYAISATENIEVFGKVGFGIAATDVQENSDAVLGVYSIQLKIDTTTEYECKMDRFNFNDTRYVNAHIDYLSKMRDDLTIERCFLLPGNHLKIYSDTTKSGYVNFNDDTTHVVEIIVKDFYGNKSTVKFNVQSNSALAESPQEPAPKGAMLVTKTKGIAVHKSNIDISLPAGATYDSFYFFSSESPLKEYMISPVYHIGDTYVPIHTAMTIGIKPPHFPDSLKSKATVVSIDPYGNYVYEGGNWNEDFLSAKVRHFGDFTVAVDTIAPVIQKEYYPADLNSSRGPVIQFSITDNLSGIKNFSALVDGKWLLLEYNKKESMLTGDISALPDNNQHNVVVTVTDQKGNEAKFSDTFYY